MGPAVLNEIVLFGGNVAQAQELYNWWQGLGDQERRGQAELWFQNASWYSWRDEILANVPIHDALRLRYGGNQLTHPDLLLNIDSIPDLAHLELMRSVRRPAAHDGQVRRVAPESRHIFLYVRGPLTAAYTVEWYAQLENDVHRLSDVEKGQLLELYPKIEEIRDEVHDTRSAILFLEDVTKPEYAPMMDYIRVQAYWRR
ncbi:hypothetical protein M501DRAFT_280151 [Patellaria atrata CBS 101060]|uniref:Uncharacterized protein n=1 Tax=Patellaria atrata CBS 101060 TaxID=1346257 RepID=A0A9P4S4D4_9PEZI|nr:hypothetical protein M501DRAFT_280151 [Patellaria atrata CBS 101060]